MWLIYTIPLQAVHSFPTLQVVEAMHCKWLRLCNSLCYLPTVLNATSKGYVSFLLLTLLSLFFQRAVRIRVLHCTLLCWSDTGCALFRLGLLIKVRCHSYGCAEGSFSVLVLVDYCCIGMAVSQCCVLLEAVLQCCASLMVESSGRSGDLASGISFSLTGRYLI